MKIIKFKKKSSDKYELYFDNKETLVLYEDVIIKNNLLVTKEITDLEDILLQNKKTEGYLLAIKFISTKIRSKKEIIEYLLRKEMSTITVGEIIIRLEEEGYINDLLFAKSYINDKLNFSNDGPFKIKNNLIKYGISGEILENTLDDISDSIVENRLSKLIKKLLKIKKGSPVEIRNKIILNLYGLGYDKSSILNELEKFEIKTDFELLKKEYDKIYSKFKNKYDDETLKRVIEQKLRGKGYAKEDIRSIKK